MTGSYYAPYSFIDWRSGRVKPCLIHEINVPSDIIWEILTDLESSQAIMPEVESIEILSDYTHGFREGVKYKEVVKLVEFLGFKCELTVYKSVIEVKHNDDASRSAKVAMTLGEDFKNTSIVWTFDVHDVPPTSCDDDDVERGLPSSTNLVFSFSLQAGGVCDRLYYMLFGCYVHKVTQKKLQHIAASTEKVALQKMKERLSTKEEIDDQEPTIIITEEESHRLAIQGVASEKLKALEESEEKDYCYRNDLILQKATSMKEEDNEESTVTTEESRRLAIQDVASEKLKALEESEQKEFYRRSSDLTRQSISSSITSIDLITNTEVESSYSEEDAPIFLSSTIRDATTKQKTNNGSSDETPLLREKEGGRCNGLSSIEEESPIQ